MRSFCIVKIYVHNRQLSFNYLSLSLSLSLSAALCQCAQALGVRVSFHFEPAPTIKIIETYCEKDDQLKPKKKKNTDEKRRPPCITAMSFCTFSFLSVILLL